jgi:hypothetical protein
MFPWLARCHISPLLLLAKHLTMSVSDIDVVVYLVSTPANLTSLVPHQTDMSLAPQGTSRPR